jgi:hypothetical protein
VQPGTVVNVAISKLEYNSVHSLGVQQFDIIFRNIYSMLPECDPSQWHLSPINIHLVDRFSMEIKEEVLGQVGLGHRAPEIELDYSFAKEGRRASFLIGQVQH